MEKKATYKKFSPSDYAIAVSREDSQAIEKILRAFLSPWLSSFTYNPIRKIMPTIFEQTTPMFSDTGCSYEDYKRSIEAHSTRGNEEINKNLAVLRPLLHECRKYGGVTKHQVDIPPFVIPQTEERMYLWENFVYFENKQPTICFPDFRRLGFSCSLDIDACGLIFSLMAEELEQHVGKINFVIIRFPDVVGSSGQREINVLRAIDVPRRFSLAEIQERTSLLFKILKEIRSESTNKTDSDALQDDFKLVNS